MLLRSVELNERLIPLFNSLQEFAEDPLSSLGINGLRNLARILNPTVEDLAPVQTVCNYATLWFRNVASLLSEGDRNGTWQRFIIVGAPQGPNNEGGPSDAPANGPTRDNYLHSNPIPNTPGSGRTNECEAGNEPYLAGRKVIGTGPGQPGHSTPKRRRSSATARAACRRTSGPRSRAVRRAEPGGTR